LAHSVSASSAIRTFRQSTTKVMGPNVDNELLTQILNALLDEAQLAAQLDAKHYQSDTLARGRIQQAKRLRELQLRLHPTSVTHNQSS
jgi:hypothetical protein